MAQTFRVAWRILPSLPIMPVAAVATAYREMVQVAKRRGSVPPPFPENAMLPQLDNTWGDTARAIFNNWLGLVYRVTDLDRRKLFKEGIDPKKIFFIGIDNITASSIA